MRPIKFRAWDRKKKQFDTCRNGGDILSFSLNYRGVSELSPKGYKVYQQYTGLKDKNGKEIYEGDICKWFSGLNDAGKVGQIVWLDTEMGWRFKENYIDYPPCIYLNVEVIGNIYENPELLK